MDRFWWKWCQSKAETPGRCPSSLRFSGGQTVFPPGGEMCKLFDFFQFFWFWMCSTGFIYRPNSKNKVSFDRSSDCGVSLPKRFFQGDDHFPPTRENGAKWSKYTCTKGKGTTNAAVWTFQRAFFYEVWTFKLCFWILGKILRKSKHVLRTFCNDMLTVFF